MLMSCSSFPPRSFNVSRDYKRLFMKMNEQYLKLLNTMVGVLMGRCLGGQRGCPSPMGLVVG